MTSFFGFGGDRQSLVPFELTVGDDCSLLVLKEELWQPCEHPPLCCFGYVGNSMKKEDYSINNFSLEHIRNKFEVLVIRLIKEFMPQFPDFDGCRTCIEDVYALSLSRIPATYVKNESLSFTEETADEDIGEIVKYAIYQVMNKPKHD